MFHCYYPKSQMHDSNLHKIHFTTFTVLEVQEIIVSQDSMICSLEYL